MKQSSHSPRPVLLLSGLGAIFLLLAGCHGVTYRVASSANDYDYLYSRAARVCGAAITMPPTAPCHAAHDALADYRKTLDVADVGVQRKAALKLTEAQLKADRAVVLKAVKALGVIP